MTPTLSQTILAVAVEVTSADEWIHLCCTAADEAAAVDAEALASSEEGRIVESLLEDDRLTAEEQDAIEAVFIAACKNPVSADGEAVALAFAANLPALTNRRNIRAFIGCVAVGMARGYFTGKAASTLLYAAQAALSAHPQRSPRSRKPRPVGFQAE